MQSILSQPAFPYYSRALSIKNWNMNYKGVRISTMHGSLQKHRGTMLMHPIARISGAAERTSKLPSRYQHHTRRRICYSAAAATVRLAPTPLLIRCPSHNARQNKNNNPNEIRTNVNTYLYRL